MKKSYFPFVFFVALAMTQLSAGTAHDSTLRLSLQNRNLSSLPDNVDFSKLVYLNIRYNQVKNFPQKLAEAKNLLEIDASYNKALNIESFNLQAKNFSLKRLSLNECNLLYFPLEYGELKQLEYLSLAGNYISTISEDYEVNTRLKYLDFSGNKISTLPKTFSGFRSLSHLDLSNNPCLSERETYEILSTLPALDYLAVKGAAVFNPIVLTNPTLKTLDISNAAFSKIELKTDLKCNLQNLLATHCENLDFSGLTPLLNVSSLREVEIGGAKFTGFSNVALSDNIQKLVLEGAQLNDFKILSGLEKLQDLDLRFKNINCLVTLISFLEKNNSIKNLSLSEANIAVIPQSIGKLKSLETLNLSLNPIANPSALFPLKQLKELNISGCELSSKELEKLKSELPDTRIINSVAPKLNLAGADENKETFFLNPMKTQTLITKNGTEIIFKANSLVYENGIPTKDSVQINYNVFYSLGSIASSGINMNYKEEGTEAPFKSAGMFELTATANGKPLEIRKGKEAEVKFKSLDSTQSYNYYSYDATKETWKKTGKDSILKFKVEKEKVERSSSVDSIADYFNAYTNFPRSLNTLPSEPIYMHWTVRKKQNMTFSFTSTNINKKVYLDTMQKRNYLFEMNELKNLKWRVEKEDFNQVRRQALDPKMNKIFQRHSSRPFKRNTVYTNTNGNKETYVKIIPDREKDNFLMQIYSGEDTLEFHAYPEFSSRNIEKVQLKTKKMFERFQSEQNTREKITTIKKEKLRRDYRKYALQAAQEKEKMLAQQGIILKEIMNSKINQGNVNITRRMIVPAMGTYNTDYPIPPFDGVILAAKYFDENDVKIKNQGAVSFIDCQSNTAFNFYGVSPVKIPSNTILTVVVMNGTNTYIGKYNTVGVKGKKGTVDLKLTKVSENFTVRDLDNYIATFQ